MPDLHPIPLFSKSSSQMQFYGDKISPEKGFRERVYGLEIIGRFEEHEKAFSGALRVTFRVREVFGTFVKRTPRGR